MTSRWMVCVFALLLGCSEGEEMTGDGGSSGGEGGSGGVPEFGAGSAFSWFTGGDEEADRLCDEWCDTEGCFFSGRDICQNYANEAPCIVVACPNLDDFCIARLCLDDAEACDAEQCRLRCRLALADTCGESKAKDLQCEIEKGSCGQYPRCPDVPEDNVTVWYWCYQQLLTACDECPECEGDTNTPLCYRANWRCQQSGGNCDADLVTSLCEKWDRAGQLACSVDQCFEPAEENPLVPRCAP